MASITIGNSGESAAHEAARLSVRMWLFAVAVLIFAMVLVGGATRLTDSGLSITEWQPLLGAIPPMSEAAWQDAFAKYQQIPQYELLNKGMSLEEFKFIYWWEWAHRFLGRMIGLVFFLPFLYFLATKRIRRKEAPKFAALFVLGGLQGALGWYMVKSGLADRIDVSQYRLAAHLGLAVAILAAILWVAFGLDRWQRTAHSVPRAVLWSAGGFLAVVYLQIILGAFVAGTDAGKSHNTWPLMDGAFIPDGLGVMSPWYRNLFENVMTVQFDHRMTAYALVLWGLLQAFFIRRSAAPGAVKTSAFLIAVAVLAQAGLGIWTVLEVVPLWLGLAHQAGAIILFVLALYHLHSVIGDQNIVEKSGY